MNNQGIYTQKRTILAIFFIVLLAFSFSPTLVNASGEPDIMTRGVSFVSGDSATLNGSVDGNGASTSVWFEYGTNTDITRNTSKKSIGRDYEDFSIEISNLRDNTTYYYRAVARNTYGTTYGAIFSFQTGTYYNNNNNYYYPNQYYQNYNYDYYNGYDYGSYNYNYYNNNNYRYNYNNYAAPTANTIPATSISNTSAQLNSTILNVNNYSSNAWFEWSTTQNLGNKTEVVFVGSSPSVQHTNTIYGLSPGTVYYYRAVAENAYWRNNGTILSFMTGGTAANQNTNTVTIIREPVIIKDTPKAQPSTPTTTTPPSSTPSNLGASATGASYTGYFLPQSIFGWLVLVILFLILLLEVRHLFGKSKTPDNHSHH